MDEMRPDPMQSFYQRVGRTTPPLPDVDDYEGPPPVPLPPLKIRWSGVLWLAGFIGICAIVARILGPRSAEVLVVLGLVGLAGATLLHRRKQPFADGDGFPLMGDVGGEAYGPVDCGDFGGGGGGDC